jgi:ABC-2 type transport system ATP-binding protein
VVEVVDVRKRYSNSSHDVVQGISFSVARGEVFGLLGPNGAGKTTSVGILTTRVRPTAGVARVAGVDVSAEPARARALFAVVPQRNNLDRSLTLRQNLVFHASYHGIGRQVRNERADELLEQFGLTDQSSSTPERLSGGQAQRVMIARALMHAPQVLFLDEPSTGLDPASRLFVWDRVQALKAAGTTVMLTTHDMHEAAVLCDRLGIMDHGQLLTLGEPSALTNDLPGERTLDVTVTLGEATTIDECTRQLLGLTEVLRVEHVTAPTTTQDNVRLRLAATGEAAALVGPVATTLSSLGAALTGVTLGDPSLEDVFIHLTGRGLR